MRSAVAAAATDRRVSDFIRCDGSASGGSSLRCCEFRYWPMRRGRIEWNR